MNSMHKAKKWQTSIRNADIVYVIKDTIAFHTIHTCQINAVKKGQVNINDQQQRVGNMQNNFFFSKNPVTEVH